MSAKDTGGRNIARPVRYITPRWMQEESGIVVACGLRSSFDRRIHSSRVRGTIRCVISPPSICDLSAIYLRSSCSIILVHTPIKDMCPDARQPFDPLDSIWPVIWPLLPGRRRHWIVGSMTPFTRGFVLLIPLLLYCPTGGGQASPSGVHGLGASRKLPTHVCQVCNALNGTSICQICAASRHQLRCRQAAWSFSRVHDRLARCNSAVGLQVRPWYN